MYKKRIFIHYCPENIIKLLTIRFCLTPTPLPDKSGRALMARGLASRLSMIYVSRASIHRIIVIFVVIIYTITCLLYPVLYI